MQYDPELFAAVKAIIIKAHTAWGDYTDSGAAYAILEEFDKHLNGSEMDRKLRKACEEATNRISAVRAVRSILADYNQPSSLPDACMYLNSTHLFPPFTFWEA